MKWSSRRKKKRLLFEQVFILSICLLQIFMIRMRLVTSLHVESDLQWGNSALQQCLRGRVVQKLLSFLPDVHPRAFIVTRVCIAAMAAGNVTSCPGNPLVCVREGAHQGLPSRFRWQKAAWDFSHIHRKLFSYIPNNCFNSHVAEELIERAMFSKHMQCKHHCGEHARSWPAM